MLALRETITEKHQCAAIKSIRMKETLVARKICTNGFAFLITLGENNTKSICHCQITFLKGTWIGCLRSYLSAGWVFTFIKGEL